MAGKLRAALLALWQAEATSPDEPDNEHLIMWVRLLVKHGKADQQALKAAERRIEDLKRTLRLPHPTTTVVGAVVEHLNAAIAVITGQVEAARPTPARAVRRTLILYPQQVNALKALLTLVHRDELAESWLQMLPEEIREGLS